MEKILAFMTSDPRDRRRFGGDSLTDQMNSVATVYLLIAFALIIQARYLIGQPVKCWCPAEFEESQVDYANSVCWTTNTYVLPFSEDIPKEEEQREHIGYYQWISLILMAQAVLFYLPRPLWRLLNKKSGIAVSTITDAALETQKKSDTESRDKAIRYMKRHLGRFLLEISRRQDTKGLLCCQSFSANMCGNYLVLVYVFIKLLYIANSVGQMYMLNAFLGSDFHLYGIDIVKKMVAGKQWNNSERFPRVTLCDFKLFVLGDIHRYTIQCSLPMNLFNEIVFVFVWFWLVLVTVATAGSLLAWIFVMAYLPHNEKHIRGMLVAMDKVSMQPTPPVKEDLRNFTHTFLRRDGVFIVRMVAKNSSDIIAAELVSELWEYFVENKSRLPPYRNRATGTSGAAVSTSLLHTQESGGLTRRHRDTT